jgi:hypothetical protein
MLNTNYEVMVGTKKASLYRVIKLLVTAKAKHQRSAVVVMEGKEITGLFLATDTLFCTMNFILI